MVPMERASVPPTLSSSSTLWATASKEWVIPAKPKPGRKPKKDAPPQPQGDDESDSKGRRVQNRAAQRAFRERKQLQLTDLQARLHQYEQGEIERTVAIQNLAKRLKEENEKLRDENKLLREKVQKFERERDDNRDHHRKRFRDETFELTSPAIPERPQPKRPKVGVDSPSLLALTPRTPVPYLSSPSSIVSTADSSDGSYGAFSPMPLSLSSHDGNAAPVPGSPFGNMIGLQSGWKPNMFDSNVSFERFECRFCGADAPCVCSEIALQQVTAPSAGSLKLENVDSSITESARQINGAAILSSQLSILENLPAYQPPVPLRRRDSQTTQNLRSTQSPFTMWLPPAAAGDIATCSGDPSNCMACAGDDFGKAFCEAIRESVGSTRPCDTCPDPQACAATEACRDLHGRGYFMDTRSSSSSQFSRSKSPNSSLQSPTMSESVPCNDVWQQLKSHPNIAFADLRLLADVVARRSKCTGPTVEITPGPETVLPERTTSPPAQFSSLSTNLAGGSAVENQSILLTDPHAHYREQQREALGPQDVLIRCGRRPVREVQAEGVREAIRLLDARFIQS